MIEAGGPAPDFTLPDQDGRSVSLSSLRGGWVGLYFYPEADTPGCTAQACGVRADKHGFSFHLLSDEGHEVADRYGAWAELSVGS